MINIIKNYKWVIASSLICIVFGLLTFFTFINRSFINLNDLNGNKYYLTDGISIEFSISVSLICVKVAPESQTSSIMITFLSDFLGR